MSYKDLPRQSALNERHLALGSTLDAEWNGMPIPQSYRTDRYEETTIVRSRAGLFDVSGLRIVNVSGPDAEAMLNAMLTSDVGKIAQGKSAISNIVDENGSLIDDVLVYRDGPQAFRVSHGGGSLEDVLPEFTEGRAVEAARDDDVHILSLQGPLALAILAPQTPFDLATLKYFEHVRTTLFGRDVSLARGGYSAERGYEVFCAAKDAVALWDAIMQAGEPFGIVAASWDCPRHRARGGRPAVLPLRHAEARHHAVGNGPGLDRRPRQGGFSRQGRPAGEEGHRAFQPGRPRDPAQ